MQKISGKLLLYSSTTIRDYRWIYIDNSVSYEDANDMRQDFLSVLKKYSNGIGFPAHIFVRCLCNGIAAYRIIKSRRVDKSGRPIYELRGFTMSFPDAWDFCYSTNEFAFDLLCHNRIRLEKLKDEDERLDYPFDYVCNDEIPTEDLGHFQKVNDEIRLFLKTKKWHNGFLMKETNGVIQFEQLIAYENGGPDVIETQANRTSRQGFFARLFRKK